MTRTPANDNEPGTRAGTPFPLYPSEAQIAKAVLGARAKEWARIVTTLESKHGFPRKSELMGGRYWPAVVLWFNQWQHMPEVGQTPAQMQPNTRFRIVEPRGH